MKDGTSSLRALILAPGGRDAGVAEQLLDLAGVASMRCNSSDDLAGIIEEGIGLCVVVEEALSASGLQRLSGWVAAQPSWSDLPFVILSLRSGGSDHPNAVRLTEALGNVTFIERPFRPSSFVSVVRSAVRARRRQYEARARIDELHQGQERLRFAQEAGRIGTFELDAQTRDVRVSSTFCRIWGLPERLSFPLTELTDLLPKEDQRKLGSMAAELKADALNYVEYRVTRPDTGEIRWIARQGESVIAPRTSETRYFGVVYDITERRRAEEALRESEARFRLIADSAPIPIWVTRLDRQREFVNRAYANFMGLSVEDALHFDWRHIIHPDDIDRIYKEQVEKEASLQPFGLEARFRSADGGWRWLRTRSQPRFDGEGAHSGFIGVAHDITDTKIAADELRGLNEKLEREVAQRTRQLRQQEAQLRTMFESSYQLQGLLSPDGRILEANARALQAIGADLDTVRGTPLWETPFCAGTPAVAARLETAILAVASGGVPFREELVLGDAGMERAFDFAMRPLTGAAEGGEFVFFEALDITERRAAEDQLRQAQKMEALGQLTGGIAHDFNNLLTGITGSLDLIKRRMATNRTEGIERFMDAAITSAQRAAALTQRLLAFARRQSLDSKATDVTALVRSLEDLLRRTLGESIMLSIETAPDLWPAFADSNQLESALVNLAINARDAMPAGGSLTITAANTRNPPPSGPGESAPEGEFVEISVADTGFGMSQAVIAKAFDPFFTTKPIGQGTGLGLSMVYGFLRQSDGHIRLKSELGRGTDVILYLRRAQAMKVAASTQLVETPRGQGETVLIVEDDASVRLLMTEVLDELGYRYLQAEDGLKAIPILQSPTPIDLLVTDVGLPHMNGRQLAEIARETRPNLKVLFVTGYAENATVRAGFLLPGAQMIAKPFALDELGARIRGLIEHA